MLIRFNIRLRRIDGFDGFNAILCFHPCLESIILGVRYLGTPRIFRSVPVSPNSWTSPPGFLSLIPYPELWISPNAPWSKSMDWFKGKSTGNHRFSHEIWGFPVNFPLNQSIDKRCFSFPEKRKAIPGFLGVHIPMNRGMLGWPSSWLEPRVPFVNLWADHVLSDYWTRHLLNVSEKPGCSK